MRSILWLGLIIQAVAVVWALRPWIAGDSRVYLELARNLHEGHFGTLQGGVFNPDTLRPPGYPLILAFQIYGLGLPHVAISLIQLGLYLASLALIERTLTRLGFNSLSFLALALIYPFAAVYSAPIMGEAWAIVAFSAMALLLCSKCPTRFDLLVVGFIAGAAALIRSDLLLVPIFVAAAVVVQQWRKDNWRAVAVSACMPILAAGCVLFPYMVWNQQHFGKLSPTPVASAVGNSLYLSTWQTRLSQDDFQSFYDHRYSPALRSSGFLEELARLNSSIGAPPLTEPFNPVAYPTEQTRIASTAVLGATARDWIKQHPTDYLRHVIGNVWLLWNTSIYPPSVPAIGRSLLRVISGLVLICGFLGVLVALRSSRWRQLLPAIALLVYLPAIHIWLHTEARYTAAARPLLLMFASLFLAAVVRVFSQWRRADPRKAMTAKKST
jgi:hypothetical protein